MDGGERTCDGVASHPKSLQITLTEIKNALVAWLHSFSEIINCFHWFIIAFDFRIDDRTAEIELHYYSSVSSKERDLPLPEMYSAGDFGTPRSVPKSTQM